MPKEITNKACELVLFGTLGDLARRKLLPALYQLDKANLIHEETRIIGVARSESSQEEYKKTVRENFETFAKEDICEETWTRFEARLVYVKMDFKDMKSYKTLAKEVRKDTVFIGYFATPPAIFGDICAGMNDAKLNTPTSRVVLEKPLGHDLPSSQAINDMVAQYFDESQVYRIDHYLGKETVLNLLALRFGNSIFANNWDHNVIDHVQITVAESVGIEGRWGFYDEAGQMRDMVQNHLMQILSLLAMEPPADLNANSVRNEKLKVLKALRPIGINEVKEKTVRGQYTAGFLKGESVPGYLEEEGANAKSNTETFVAIKAEIDNWRWAGVPFYLRTGKRLTTKHSEIVVQFKPQPHNIFKDSYKDLPANKLTIRLQPDEGVEISVMNKQPGIGEQFMLQETKLDLSFSDTFDEIRIADAYERLLLETMLGNQSLFVRKDEVEQAWTWVDGIIDAWSATNEKPKPYQAGTWGPVASIGMIARDDRAWDE